MSATKTPRPVGEFILIRRDQMEETTAAGLFNPNAAKTKLDTGTVVDCGAGVAKHLHHEPGTRVRWTPTGRQYPIPCEKGEPELLVVHQEAIYLVE